MAPNPKYNFAGKVALVTGSSSGIGEAIATQLAQYGAKVVITGRNAERLAKVAADIESISRTKPLQVVADLRNDATPKKLIEATIKEYGQLDVLVNNAGATVPAGNLASSNLLEEFDQCYKLNVRSVVELTQLAVPYLEKTSGNIVNISSAVSVKPMGLVYSSSKAALDMITKTSALELGPKGIRVNSVNPGPVATRFSASRGWSEEQIDSFYPQLAERMLMKRVGTAEDIANVVSFVASEDAQNVTGSIYFSDSGTLIAPPVMHPTSLSLDKK